jgi:hypothetical protein
VVVHDENLQRRFTGEGVEDPAVELATDLTVVDIRFRRVHADDLDGAVGGLDGFGMSALPEQVLVVEVADAARVVVAGR